MSKSYIAVIGDICSSRNVVKREAVQDQLQKALDDINAEYAEHIAAKFVITLGDEFQGLLISSCSVMDIIDKINESLEPLEIRYGIGVGEIWTKINPDMALGADGPAFHCARKAIEDVKKNNRKSKSERTNIRIEIENKNTEMINSLLSMLYIQKKQWTKNQRRTIRAYKRNGKRQTACAKFLNTSQSVVSRQLNAANYFSCQNASEVIDNYLAKEISVG